MIKDELSRLGLKGWFLYSEIGDDMTEDERGCMVKTCWHCDAPFVARFTHHDTGHVFRLCASCHAPIDLGDSEGLRILETEPGFTEYVSEWKAQLRRREIKVVTT